MPIGVRHCKIGCGWNGSDVVSVVGLPGTAPTRMPRNARVMEAARRHCARARTAPRRPDRCAYNARGVLRWAVLARAASRFATSRIPLRQRIWVTLSENRRRGCTYEDA